MKIKLITVAFNTESGGFPQEPLCDVEGEVLSVIEHFFEHSGVPHLLLVVHHRPTRGEHRSTKEARAASSPARTGQGLAPAPAASVRAELPEQDRELFDRLRAWRNGRAQAEGVPPYVLLHNRQLAQIARTRPVAMTALREIDGIGEAKASRFGAALLAMVAEAVPAPHAA